MLEAMAEVPGGLAPLTFIEGVALTVSASRLDAIVLSHEAPRLAALEKVLIKLVEVLPHTPLRGLGCNLQFVDDDPSDTLLAFFNSPEGIEGDFTTHDRQFSVQLDIEGGILNFNRAEINGTVRFGFNYHYSPSEPEEYAAIIPDLVNKSREHASKLLAALYGLNEFETISYMKISEQEAVGVETANPIVESNH